MEHVLKPPTQPRKVSEADQKRISHFKDFITHGTTAPHLHKVLIGLYVNYTRFLIQNPDKVATAENDDELYYLSELISIAAEHE